MSKFKMMTYMVQLEFDSNMRAIADAKQEIEDHEFIGDKFGLTPIVAVHFGSISVWLRESKTLAISKDAVLTKPVQFICNKPVYRFTHEGRTVNVLGE